MRVFVAPVINDVQIRRIAGEIVNMETRVLFFINGSLLKTPRPNYGTHTVDGADYTIVCNNFTIMIDPRSEFPLSEQKFSFAVNLGEMVKTLYARIDKYRGMFDDTIRYKTYMSTHYTVCDTRWDGDISSYAIVPGRKVGRYFMMENFSTDDWSDHCRFSWNVRRGNEVASIFNFHQLASTPRANSVILITANSNYALDNTSHMDYLNFTQCNAVASRNIFPHRVMYSAHTGHVLPFVQFLRLTNRETLNHGSYASFATATEKYAAILSPTWINYEDIRPHKYKKMYPRVSLIAASKDVCAVTGLPLYDDFFVIDHLIDGKKGNSDAAHVCLHPYVVYHTKFLSTHRDATYILARSRSPVTFSHVLKRYTANLNAGDALFVDLIKAVCTRAIIDGNCNKVIFGKFVLVGVLDDKVQDLLSHDDKLMLVLV